MGAIIGMITASWDPVGGYCIETATGFVYENNGNTCSQQEASGDYLGKALREDDPLPFLHGGCNCSVGKGKKKGGKKKGDDDDDDEGPTGGDDDDPDSQIWSGYPSVEPPIYILDGYMSTNVIYPAYGQCGVVY